MVLSCFVIGGTWPIKTCGAACAGNAAASQTAAKRPARPENPLVLAGRATLKRKAAQKRRKRQQK
jgi:hypothetical protein